MYVSGYLALLVTGHSVCDGESCFKSVQLVAGILYMHWYCLQLYPFCFGFVLVKNDGLHYVGVLSFCLFYVFKSLATVFAVTCAG